MTHTNSGEFSDALILMPVNGLGNRLRSLAAGAKVGQLLNRELWVLWRNDQNMGLSFGDVFESFPNAVDANDRLTPEQIDYLYEGLPPYLSLNADSNLISLRGLDKGEQIFVEDLRNFIREFPSAGIVVSAGNFFDLDLSPSADMEEMLSINFRSRHDTYSGIKFTESIRQLSRVLKPEEPFVGVHIRAGDRSHLIPERRKMLSEVLSACEDVGTQTVYIATDSLRQRNRWKSGLADRGLLVRASDSTEPGRRDTAAAMLSAIADWHVLASSDRLVFSRTSTFATEAAALQGRITDHFSLEPRTRVWHPRFIRNKVKGLSRL